MSSAQRETMESLMEKVSVHKLSRLGKDSSRDMDQVEAFLNTESGPIQARDIAGAGMLTGMLYEDQMWRKVYQERDAPKGAFSGLLPQKTGVAKTRAEARSATDPIDLKRFTISGQAYLKKLRRLPINRAIGDRGDKTVAVILAEGGIVEKKGDEAGANDLVVENFRNLAQLAAKDEKVAAVVVRINSPGGDALASDIMWREVNKLRECGKPVVASICSVAASGGYYISMACDKIVADEQSITGSIGVVLTKFNLQELFKKAGYNVERISRGRWAEVFAYERGFTAAEEGYWAASALEAYESFITKAASSRGMQVDDMHRRAQGRVWTGTQGKYLGLVDEIGGLQSAVELARDMADEREGELLGYRDFMKKVKKDSEAAEEKAMLDEWELLGYEFKDYRDVVEFQKAVTSAAGSAAYTGWEMLTECVARQSAEVAERGVKGKQGIRETKMKYLQQKKSPFASLMLLSSLLGMSGPGIQAPLASDALAGVLNSVKDSVGKPLLVMDDAIVRAMPGLAAGVPASLSELGVGPLEYHLLGRDEKFVGQLLEQVTKMLGISKLEP
ncbi:unnamed protein product [Chrysoparadoxa australica]